MAEELRKLLSVMSQYEHLSLASLFTTMLIAITCGFIIYLVYRFFYRGVAYSENFGILIVMVSGITAFIIITIGANLVLSLGMVGALSIVRFRAAIKEPLDIAFIYWGVAVGLTTGARLYFVAIVGTVCVALVYVGMTFLRKSKTNYLFILQYPNDSSEEVDKLLKNIQYKLKNKTIRAHETELTAEIILKKNNTKFLNNFTASEHISNVILVEYTGDYT